VNNAWVTATDDTRPGPRAWLVRGAVVLAVLAVASTAASLWLYAYNLPRVTVELAYLYGDAVAGLLYPLAGAYLVRRRPGNAVGWVFASTSVLALNAFANQYAVTALLVHPGHLPLGRLAAWIGTWGWTPALFVPTLLPLLFPGGTVPSPRWRPYLKVVLTVLTVLVVGTMVAHMPIDATTAILNPVGAGLPEWTFVVVPVCAVLCIYVLTPVSAASLVLRLRRAEGAERAQLSWLTLAAVVAIVGAAGAAAVPEPWNEAVWALGVVAIPAGVLVAVVRHQLLDIEVVLNRAVVSVLLTGVVLLGYVVAVVGVGEAAGQRVGIVAVAVLALLVASARGRVQGLVDRGLYGHRRDPYAVVSRVGRRLDVATGPRDALASLVDELCGVLRLPYAAVVPADPELPAVESGRAVAEVESVPVSVLGERVAVLTVGHRHRGERFRAEERSALEDVARRAGGLVQATALVADLQRSRERIVTAREEERRRLRHDLHDGVGPQLAGMALQLDSLAARLGDDPALAARAEKLRDRMRATVVEVRRVVDDLRPPALDELGLVEALRQQVSLYVLDGGGVEVLVDGPLPALPAAVEVAAYRVAGEAVANAVRHSGCRRCTLRIGVESGLLAVEVADDGSGIAPDALPHVGLQSMRERAAEIGGRLDVSTGDGGTTVRAWFPLAEPAGSPAGSPVGSPADSAAAPAADRE
jgi:signal transduction histidine kinase